MRHVAKVPVEHFSEYSHDEAGGMKKSRWPGLYANVKHPPMTTPIYLPHPPILNHHLLYSQQGLHLHIRVAVVHKIHHLVFRTQVVHSSNNNNNKHLNFVCDLHMLSRVSYRITHWGLETLCVLSHTNFIKPILL